MQYIDFNVQHQTITRTDNYEVVGRSQNYLYARFTFCEEWEGLTQTAVFSTNSGKHYSALIEEGECLVPWEVLQGAEFWVGVFAGERITTSTVRVAVKPGVKIGAKPGMAPSPTAYETLVANAAASAETAEAASEQAAASAEMAAQAEQTVQDAIERAEQVVESVVLNEEKMAQYVDAAEGHADTAAESAQAASDFAAEAEDWSKKAEAAAGGGVLSFNARSGYVEPQAGDYTAEMVGARPDTWMPSAADVGAAPAGYGYGEKLNMLEVTNDTDGTLFDEKLDELLDTIGDDGCKQIGFTDYPYLSGSAFYGTLFRRGVNYAVLIGTTYSGYTVSKTKLKGVWKPWEWVNPPMLEGKEYRTTERYLDKPVYVQVINFGALPNNTMKTITFGDSTMKMISASAVMKGGYVIPGCTGSSGFPDNVLEILTADGGIVGIATHVDRSSQTAVVVAKYWKTTD